MSRRTVLRAGLGGAVAAVATSLDASPARAAGRGGARRQPPAPVRELFDKIQQDMVTYAVPGVAVGLWYQGCAYLRGFGVADVGQGTPVGPDTVFRIASTSKTFTGTTMQRLVERGLVELDAPVRRYLPELRTADPAVAGTVTVRQLLNHTAGWLGDYFTDTGQGEDALARYVAGLDRVPQLTAPGTVFAYNNAALSVAGRVIEAVRRQPYEQAVQELLIRPLGLTRSRFFVEGFRGVDIAAPHDVLDGVPVAVPEYYPVPRGIHPAGGLISSARDQLRYARFQLGDGRVPGGRERLLTQRSLVDMRSDPGPGGTLFVELAGVGVTWLLRPTAEGVRVVQHGGDLPGQHSGFIMVPERDFALTVLTNCETGPALLADLFVGDWALRRFAGVSNLPAVPLTLTDAQLAEYTGTYLLQQLDLDGSLITIPFQLVAAEGQLAAVAEGQVQARLILYRPDYALAADPAGQPDGSRVNFVRGADGQVAWLRVGGRLIGRAPAATAFAEGGAGGKGDAGRVRRAFEALRLPHLTADPGR